MKCTLGWVLLPVALSATVVLSGCHSQGDYTRSHREDVQVGLDRLQAGTQYDEASRAFALGDMEAALLAIENSLTLEGDVPTAHELHARVLIE